MLGNQGTDGVDGKNGSGGAGVVSTGGSSITSAGNISGGLAGDGTTRANAVTLSGGGNTLTLEDGYRFTGNVVSGSGATNGGDTLALGGSTNGTFNLAQVVAAKPSGWNGNAQYFGFKNFEKVGSSTWTVTGTGTAFGGGIDVAEGTLQVGDGTTPTSIGGGTARVESGATLSGFGTVAASTTVAAGGVLSPGAAGDIGTLTIDGPLTMLGTLAIDIGGTGSGNFDFLDVTGGATFATSSFFDFAFSGDSNQHAGDAFEFFDANSLLNFADASSNFSCGGLLADLTCALNMNGDGNGLVLTLNRASSGGGGPLGVPEPGSLGMLGLGIILLGSGIGWRRWRDSREA